MKPTFTYGFEIEGIFTKKFLTELEKEINKPRNKYKITDYDFKEDGSVNCDEDALAGSDGEITELNLGVFKSLESMLKALRIFKDGKNYFQNETCGLHIHIKPYNVELRGKLASYKFIMKLQAWAKKNLCACTSKRLNNTGHNYCKPYSKSFKEMKDYFKTGEKYVAIRNHPSGTYEFRFFSACPHRVENVKKFFNYFLAEVKKLKFSQKKVFKIEDEGKKEREYNYKTEGVKKDLEIKLPLYLPIGEIKTLTALKEIQDKREREKKAEEMYRKQQEELRRERAMVRALNGNNLMGEPLVSDEEILETLRRTWATNYNNND